MHGVIVAVASSGAHTLSKARQPEVTLVEGRGIERMHEVRRSALPFARTLESS
jgi:hypothetical protein